MEIYLVIITTVLVITQIVRIAQNAIQLHRQNILFKEQLGSISTVTEEDFQTQRKAYRLIVEHLDEKDDTVRCNGCDWYLPESETCKLWNAVRHPDHYCGEGVPKHG